MFYYTNLNIVVFASAEDKNEDKPEKMDTTPAPDKKGNNYWLVLLFTMFLNVSRYKIGPLFLTSPQQSLFCVLCVQMPRRRRMP